MQKKLYIVILLEKGCWASPGINTLALGGRNAGYEGHNAAKYGGHPAPSGRALPNLLMRSEC